VAGDGSYGQLENSSIDGFERNASADMFAEACDDGPEIHCEVLVAIQPLHEACKIGGSSAWHAMHIAQQRNLLNRGIG
jgi:hypothetical protein